MVKRRKIRPTIHGQLCLFGAPDARQEEEGERKPEIKPVEALKSVRPTLIPPTPVEAVKTPENGLKTEVPGRDELNRLWKGDPEALHVLNRMKKVNPSIITLVQAFGLVPQRKKTR